MRHGRATLGLDPEFFLKKDGEVVPADNYLPNDQNKMVVHRGASIYYDGIQGEFSSGPHTCRAWIMDEIVSIFREVSRIASRNGLTYHFDASLPITKATLDAAKDPVSREFGCDPDFLACEMGAPNIIDLDASKHLTRYAGAHIHVGTSLITASAEARLRSVWLMDRLIGLALVPFESEADVVRRKVYGKGSSYREKPYGVEYRTPGPALLRHPAILNLMLELARVVPVHVNSNDDEDLLKNLSPQEVANAINNGDKDFATRVFIETVECLLPKGGLHNGGVSIETDSYRNRLFEILRMDNPLEAFSDFENAWGVNISTPSNHGSLTPDWEEFCQGKKRR